VSASNSFDQAIKEAENEVQKYKDLQSAVVAIEGVAEILGKHYGAYSETMKRLDALKDDVLAKRWGVQPLVTEG